MLRRQNTPAGPGRAREQGSVLMLMPAAIMIVLVLGAITVDLTVVRLGQRELIAAAGDAANDASTYGIDQSALRSGRGVVLDPDRAREAVVASLDAKGLLDRLASPPEVVVDADGTVEVRLVRRVPYVFAKALPGLSDGSLVRGSGAARLVID